MLSLILSQIIILGLIHFLPVQQPEPSDVADTFPNEEIFIAEIINTRQQSAPAAPPKPIPPVPVPDDQIIDEEIDFPDIDDLFFENPFRLNEEGTGVEGESEAVVGSPEVLPSIVRIVEPTIPEAAKDAGIKARILVTFLVDTNGAVEEAYVNEIRLYNGDEYRVVNSIGYGILEAVMEASLKWRFRPAKNEGMAVKTYVENSFTIGF